MQAQPSRYLVFVSALALLDERDPFVYAKRFNIR